MKIDRLMIRGLGYSKFKENRLMSVLRLHSDSIGSRVVYVDSINSRRGNQRRQVIESYDLNQIIAHYEAKRGTDQRFNKKFNELYNDFNEIRMELTND